MCLRNPGTLSSAEFCYPIRLDLTPKLPPYSRVAIFQKLWRSMLSVLLNWVAGKFKLPISYFWVLTPGIPNLDFNFQPIGHFPGMFLICIPYPRLNCLKTIPFTWQYPSESYQLWICHTHVVEIIQWQTLTELKILLECGLQCPWNQLKTNLK